MIHTFRQLAHFWMERLGHSRDETVRSAGMRFVCEDLAAQDNQEGRPTVLGATAASQAAYDEMMWKVRGGNECTSM